MDLLQLEEQLQGQGKLPPLTDWQPELSGEMDMLIKANGEWWHEGSEIKRHALVKLFASILCRENDGHYYLLTPVEKWRIRVERTPLLIIDFEVAGQREADQRLVVSTNVGRSYCVGKKYPLSLRPEASGPIPQVVLDHGVEACLDRPAFYRLIDVAELSEESGSLSILSDGERFELGCL